MDTSILTTLSAVFRLAIPEATMVAFACVIFLGAAFRPSKNLWGVFALLGLATAGFFVSRQAIDISSLRPSVSVLWPDHLAFYTRVAALIGGGILLLASWDELADEWAGDYFALLLILTAGVCLVGAANELITLFLALELISIPTYVLLYLPRGGLPVQESAIKYFLLSIFSSALLMFGFSYLYGITGTTNIPAILDALSRAEAVPLSPMILVATVFIIAGLGFRITAVPFHFYAPDVYEGSANGPAALLAFVPKLAGFVALIRLLGLIGPAAMGSTLSLNALIAGTQLPLLFWILAAITMTVGNIIAVWQDDIKRLLAYSGIAHSGYMLIGLAVAPYQAARPDGSVGAVAALLFYLMAYGAMTIGAFAILQALSTRERQVAKIDELAGLGGTHPGLALFMALFLFSLIGLPLTAGFTGKLLLFYSAMSAHAGEQNNLLQMLVFVAAINAAIGAFYYLRMIGVMYLRTATKPLPGRPGVAGLIALWLCAGITLWLGCYPPAPLEFSKQAAMPTAAGEPVRAARLN